MESTELVLSKLEDLIKIQEKSNSVSGYMAGLYNGLQIAKSIITEEEPKFADNPDIAEKKALCVKAG